MAKRSLRPPPSGPPCGEACPGSVRECQLSETHLPPHRTELTPGATHIAWWRGKADRQHVLSPIPRHLLAGPRA